MEKDTLRMQFLSGVITEGQYKEKLQENENEEIAAKVEPILNKPEVEKKSKKNINESILLTLGGIALGGAIIKRAYDYLSNRSLINKMTPTGNVRKSTGGDQEGNFFTMKEYRDNDTDETYWGIDVTDDTRDQGFRDRKVLLFKGDDPKRIERILKLEVAHDYSDQARMSDDYEKRFGQFKADKVMRMGDNTYDHQNS